MKNRKIVKLLTVAALVVMIFTATFALTACGGKKYVVEFIYNGEFLYGISTDGKSKVAFPGDPSDLEKGKTLAWFLDEACTKPMEKDTFEKNPITADAKLYSKVVDRVVTLTFVNGETVVSTIEFNGASAITLPEAPAAPAGKVFSGWFLDEAGTKPVAEKTFEDTPVTYNTKVYAKYADIQSGAAE